MFEFWADIDFAGTIAESMDFDSSIDLKTEGLIDPEIGAGSMDTLSLLQPGVYGDEDGSHAERIEAAINDIEAAFDDKKAIAEQTDKETTDAIQKMLEAFAEAQKEASATPSKRDLDGDDLKG